MLTLTPTVIPLTHFAATTIAQMSEDDHEQPGLESQVNSPTSTTTTLVSPASVATAPTIVAPMTKLDYLLQAQPAPTHLSDTTPISSKSSVMTTDGTTPTVSRKRSRSTQEHDEQQQEDREATEVALNLVNSHKVARTEESEQQQHQDQHESSGPSDDESTAEHQSQSKSSGNTGGGAPRERRLKSLSQLVVLKNFYAQHPRVTKDQVRKLIAQTGLTHREVTRWFRNERHKEKKMKTQASLSASMNPNHQTYQPIPLAQQETLFENERKKNQALGDSAMEKNGNGKISHDGSPQQLPSLPLFNPLQPQMLPPIQPNFYNGRQANAPTGGYGFPGGFPGTPGMMMPTPPNMMMMGGAPSYMPMMNTNNPTSPPNLQQMQYQAQQQQSLAQAQHQAAVAQQQFQSAMQATTNLLMQGANPAALMPGYMPGYGPPGGVMPPVGGMMTPGFPPMMPMTMGGSGGGGCAPNFNMYQPPQMNMVGGGTSSKMMSSPTGTMQPPQSGNGFQPTVATS